MEHYALDLSKMFNNKEPGLFDKPVPIVKHGSTYHCYLTTDIEAPEEYSELCYLLNVATANNKIILNINTGGGQIDSAFQIIAAIKHTKATVIARLAGTVASAGTIIALKCDGLEVEDYTHFMVHNYSTGTQGKGHEVIDYINFNDKDLKNTFREIYSGFLTPEEITDVLRGKDMWLTADDVRVRWSNKQGIKE
jgi:ATP-dependent protease ClpP protease subunit